MSEIDLWEAEGGAVYEPHEKPIEQDTEEDSESTTNGELGTVD